MWRLNAVVRRQLTWPLRSSVPVCHRGHVLDGRDDAHLGGGRPRKGVAGLVQPLVRMTRVVLVLAAALAGCAPAGSIDDSMPPTVGGALGVPRGGGPARPSITLPPPGERIGLYDWDVDAGVVPGQNRLLAPGELALGLGAQEIRLALTVRDDYGVFASLGVNGASYTLAQIADGNLDGSGQDRVGYRTLISDPRLKDVLLTTYGAVDYGLDSTKPIDAGTLASARAEIADLGAYLLQTYSGKRFLICPWEGDNAMTLGGASSVEALGGPAAWDNYTAWLRARAEGVADARARVPGASATIYSCLEWNAYKRTDNGQTCGVSPGDANTPSDRCVISYVAPQLADVVDYFSYSSWQSMSPTVATDLPKALDAASGYLPGVDHARFLLGEFGGAREDWNECVAAQIASDAIDAALGWGVSFTNFWQVGDNAAAGIASIGFGAYKIGGGISLTGKMLQQRLAGQPVSIAAPSACPSIAAYQNAADYSQTVHAGDYVALYGGYPTGGDRVTFFAGSTRSAQGAGDVTYFFDGKTQINAQVPSGFAGTPQIRVYATDANGLDSNASIVTLTP